MRSEDVGAANREAIRVVLAKAKRALSTREIMAATGLSDKTVQVRRKELVLAGRVTRVGRAWTLTPAGRK
jgi:DNA-binding HxlR family transcriptional regulator